ncbi:hypothetical protein DIPPA_08487 [Diplonema papillatum]|nr:hypothetical protein DIPPA_08487 [Diplonema papillatum]
MGSAATKGNHGQRKILQRFDPFDPSVGLPYEDGSLSYAGQHASQYQPGPTANGSASSDDLRAFKLAFADSSGNIEEFRMLPAELNMTLDGIKEKLESLFKSRLQGSGLLTGFRDTDGDFVTLKTEAEFRLFIEKQDEQTPMRLEVRREQTEPVLSSSHSAEARDAKRGRRRGATFAAGVRRGSQLQGKKKARAKESKSLTYRGTSDRNVDESISAGRAMSATCPALNEDDETSSGESSSHSTSSSGSIDPDSANEFAKQKETVRHLKLNDDSYSVDRGAAGKNERRTSHGKAAKPLKENGFGAHSPIAVSLDETTFTDETCLAEVPSTKKCHKAAKLHKHLRESKAIRWKRGKLLGRGAFGQVHLAMNIMTDRLRFERIAEAYRFSQQTRQEQGTPIEG